LRAAPVRDSRAPAVETVERESVKSLAAGSAGLGREVFGLALTESVPGIAPKDFVTPDQHGTGSRQLFCQQ
jgi:hypothetical protein